GDGTYGVDPNRNYPYEWGGGGSSPYPGDDTYRGPSPGSEPCVQAMMNFVNSHELVTNNSVHTYSNLTLFPWGYTTGDTPDHDIFVAMGQAMTMYNGYEYGQPADLLYDVNGGTNDWVYGAQGEHQKCFSFTNEIGSYSDGFWPDDSRRQQLFDENIWPAVYLMQVAGIWIDASDETVSGGNGDSYLDPGETANLSFVLTNNSV
ncbi:MAG: zinc carboxypeptidase, partial [Gammaproteobacteria bacterium]|nr:zinc carboxypeptidase [Gammaproteobacteria bacterium]